VAQGVGPEFKPQYCKKKKKISKRIGLLPSKHEALNSNPNTLKKIIKERKLEMKRWVTTNTNEIQRIMSTSKTYTQINWEI
jgi:hypothetical protein